MIPVRIPFHRLSINDQCWWYLILLVKDKDAQKMETVQDTSLDLISKLGVPLMQQEMYCLANLVEFRLEIIKVFCNIALCEMHNCGLQVNFAYVGLYTRVSSWFI